MFPSIHGVVSQDGAAGGGGGGGGATGIVSIAASSNLNTRDQRGWRFTVGASNITVSGLRTFINANHSETIRLWRVSDQTLLASVTVNGAPGSWVDGAITPVVLSSGADYIVTTQPNPNTSTRSGKAASIGDVTFNSAVSWVANHASNGTGSTTYPSITLNSTFFYGFADIIFTVD